MSEVPQVNSLEEAAVHIASLRARLDEMERLLVDHDHRFDSLQSSWLRRVWFRIDGWPGRRDLNADKRAWRPWH